MLVCGIHYDSVAFVDVYPEGNEDMGLYRLLYYLLRNLKTDLGKTTLRMFVKILVLLRLLKIT